MKTLSRAARVTAAVGAAAFGLVGLAGTASAGQEAPTRFEVCSPATPACSQKITGTVERTGTRTARVVAAATNNAASSVLVASFVVSGWEGSESRTVFVPAGRTTNVDFTTDGSFIPIQLQVGAQVQGSAQRNDVWVRIP